MAQRRRQGKKVKVDVARIYRSKGLSYAAIGAKMGVSPSGIYYALKPRARKSEGRLRSGSPRSVYFSDRLWDGIMSTADQEGLSASRLLAAIAVGEHDPITLEPEIPNA